MFELTELLGLISEPLYARLGEITVSPAILYDNFKLIASVQVTKSTGFDEADLDALPVVKEQLNIPFAWIVEKYAMPLMTMQTAEYISSVNSNYNRALDMLGKISKAEPTTTDDLIGSFPIFNLWGNW